MDSNYSRTKPSGNKSTVDDEVRRLFKKNKGQVDANEFIKVLKFKHCSYLGPGKGPDLLLVFKQ